MPALARTRSYAYLDVFTGSAGAVADAAVVQFQIFDISSDTKRATPVQIHPATAGQRTSLNVTTDKVSTGRYRTTWAPTGTSRGRHRVSWYWKLTADGTEQQTDEDFDVVDAARSWGYCLPSDLRDEGLMTTDAAAQRLANVIAIATQMIENFTGRWFEPRQMTFTLDANDQRVLNLPHPIISLTSVTVDTTAVELDDINVYNRHLAEGLTSPDDRAIPKLEWSTGDLSYGGAWMFSPGIWPKGQRIVEVIGLFGYTEPDAADAVVGVLPLLLRHACKLMVMREFPTLTDFDNREDRQRRWRIATEATQGVSQNFQAVPRGACTGDPEIDNLLLAFRKLPRVGAV